MQHSHLCFKTPYAIRSYKEARKFKNSTNTTRKEKKATIDHRVDTDESVVRLSNVNKF